MPRRLGRSGEPDLVSDLIWLRKGAGATYERLAQAAAVIAACGGTTHPIESIHERFAAAVRSMHDTAGGQALWAAYGMETDKPGLLKDRRAKHAASVGRTADTVLDWEEQAIHELALRLLSSYYAGAPTPGQLPIPHGGYLMSRLTVVCIIRDRRFVESRQTRTLISLVDGAPHFTYGTYSPTELSNIEGGTLALSKRVTGGVVHRIDFPEPLHRGQAHTFSFRERVPEAEPEPVGNQDFSGQSFESPTLRYQVGVHFLGQQPAVVWGYDKLSRIERPGEPEDGFLLESNRDRISIEFADLYGGLCAGVAWRWE